MITIINMVYDLKGMSSIGLELKPEGVFINNL